MPAQTSLISQSVDNQFRRASRNKEESQARTNTAVSTFPSSQKMIVCGICGLLINEKNWSSFTTGIRLIPYIGSYYWSCAACCNILYSTLTTTVKVTIAAHLNFKSLKTPTRKRSGYDVKWQCCTKTIENFMSQMGVAKGCSRKSRDILRVSLDFH